MYVRLARHLRLHGSKWHVPLWFRLSVISFVSSSALGSQSWGQSSTFDPNTLTQMQAYEELKQMPLVSNAQLLSDTTAQIVMLYQQQGFNLDPSKISLDPAEFSILPPQPGLEFPFTAVEFACGSINYDFSQSNMLNVPPAIIVYIHAHQAPTPFFYTINIGYQNVLNQCELLQQYKADN